MSLLPKIARGVSATSCVSLIAPKMDINELRNFVSQERTTAKNIKNNVNRKSVVDALGRVSGVLDTLKSIPDSGIAIYAHSSI